MTVNAEFAQNEEAHDLILAELCDEFLADAGERLEDISEQIEIGLNADCDAQAVLLAIRRQCHNLKGMGGSFGFPTITLISHRLEDYLARARVIDKAIANDIDCYCRHLTDIVSAGKDPGPDSAARIVRDLPAITGFQIEDIDPKSTEVLLVTPSKTIGAIVARELNECGYAVTRVSNALEALQFAATTKPDLLITAAVMEIIDGISLARALAVIKPTANIPVGLLTSLDSGSRELDSLPDSVAVIRHGEYLSDDLAKALNAFESGTLKLAATG